MSIIAYHEYVHVPNLIAIHDNSLLAAVLSNRKKLELVEQIRSDNKLTTLSIIKATYWKYW